MNYKPKHLYYIFASLVVGGLYFTFAFPQLIHIINGAYGPADSINHATSGLHLFTSLSNGIEGLYSFYQSDPYPHIMLYPLWHFLFFLCHLVSKLFFSKEISIAIAIALVNAFFIGVTHYIISLLLQPCISRFKNKWYISSLLALTLLLVGPLDGSLWYGNYYLGGYTANPWHNPTYIAVRPIALLIFSLYAHIFCVEDDTWKDYVNVSILLLISAFIKPTFYQVFLPGLVLYCVVMFLKKRTYAALIKNIKIAITCMPVTLVALLQVFLLPTTNHQRIGISFLYVWKAFTEKWLLSLLFSVAFPLIVYVILSFKRTLTIECRLSLCAFISALLQYMLLFVAEDPLAGDFSWGLDLSLFLLFYCALKQLISVLSFTQKKAERAWLTLPVLIYFLHLFYGIWYFLSFFLKNTFIAPLPSLF